MTSTTAEIAEILELTDSTRGEEEHFAYVSKSRILAEASVLGHLMVNPKRNAAGQRNEEGDEKRNCCCPSFRFRLVLQRANYGMQSVEVEPDKDVNRCIDGEYDGAVEEVTDGVTVDGDHPPEGAQEEEKAHGEVREGQADDIQVEPLTKNESRTRAIFWNTL